MLFCLQILLLTTKLRKAGFESVVFYNQKIVKFPPEEKSVPIGIAIKKRYPFYISFLYSRIVSISVKVSVNYEIFLLNIIHPYRITFGGMEEL